MCIRDRDGSKWIHLKGRMYKGKERKIQIEREKDENHNGQQQYVRREVEMMIMITVFRQFFYTVILRHYCALYNSI